MDVHEASLHMACAWGRESVERFDAARAAAPPPPGCVPYWNVVFAGASTTVRVRLAAAGGSGDGGTETAQALGRPGLSVTRRAGVFALARGPLPRSVVPEVHSPWFLLGWL